MCLYISKTVNNIYRLRYIRDSIRTRCCVFTVSMEMNRLVCNESNSKSNSILSVSILAIAFTLTQSQSSCHVIRDKIHVRSFCLLLIYSRNLFQFANRPCVLVEKLIKHRLSCAND